MLTKQNYPVKVKIVVYNFLVPCQNSCWQLIAWITFCLIPFFFMFSSHFPISFQCLAASTVAVSYLLPVNSCWQPQQPFLLFQCFPLFFCFPISFLRLAALVAYAFAIVVSPFPRITVAIISFCSLFFSSSSSSSLSSPHSSSATTCLLRCLHACFLVYYHHHPLLWFLLIHLLLLSSSFTSLFILILILSLVWLDPYRGVPTHCRPYHLVPY